MKPIAYTLGEPAGIGPDIIIQLAQEALLQDVVCIGDAELLQIRAAKLGLPLKVVDCSTNVDLGCLNVLHQALPDPTVIGTGSTENVSAVLSTLNTAIDGCLRDEFSAMVTGPIHKGLINDGLITNSKQTDQTSRTQSAPFFSGHTEYLASRTAAALPVMLLATEEYRVALITTHLALKDVSAAITHERIVQTCRIIHADMKSKYGFASPKIMVAGLNPHAGEGGHLGDEEITTIIPALNQLRSEGMDLIGPVPADTLFTPRLLSEADVAIAMYHDQGLGPIKALSFGCAANITLGLPIIRTSVDHGTAFDLAGSGNAHIGGLKTAINVARTFALNAAKATNTL